MARLPRQDDAFIQNNLWFKNWVAWMHSDARPAGWDRSPLTYMPHEGTFYPLHVVRAFSALGIRLCSRALHLTCIGPARLAERASTRRPCCPHSYGSDTHNS